MKRIDHTDKQYANFKAIRFAKYERNRSYWFVRCVCGKEVIRPIYMVSSGRLKSCGCLAQEHKKTPISENDIFHRAYYGHLYRARVRGLENFLSREDYISIVKKPCHYCGAYSERGYSKNHTMEKQKVKVICNSVDRRNSEPFYNKDNAVPSCFICQRMKNDLTEGDFIHHIKRILSARGAE